MSTQTATKTALIVDDSRSARFALRRCLEHHAYHVETAESAEEAYRLLQTQQPEVIFLDHVMPGTDGFTALQHIKQNPQTGSIPVVICSSNEGDAFTAEARSKGAVDVLQKPPSPERLTRILDNLHTLSAQLRQQQPESAAPMPPPTTPSKVTSLREPDVTLGQAVIKVLRHTLGRDDSVDSAAAAATPPAAAAVISTPPVAATPPPPAPAPAVAVTAPPAPSVAVSAPPAARPTPAPAVTPAVEPAVVAGPMEARLKKLTQDLFGQLAEIKAGMALLESRLPDPGEEPPPVADVLARESLQDLQQRLGWLESRFEARLHEIEQAVERRLAAEHQRVEQHLATLPQPGEIERQLEQRFGQRMEQRLEELQQAQNRRLDDVMQQARATASEEARAASERTVMSAAARIADQLADSIARALGRK